MTPGSLFRPFRAKMGEGMPHRGRAELADAIRRVPHDRRGVVGEYAGEERQVARDVPHRAGEVADRLLALRQE